MTDPPAPSRRSSLRKRTLKAAKVVLNDSSTFDCVLRNLSDGGARLEFTDPIPLPETFNVLIVASNSLLPAQRVWERGLSVGIMFTGPERPAPPRRL